MTAVPVRRPAIAPEPVAPAWHTVLLVVALALLAWAGARLQSRSSPGPESLAERRGVVPLYFSTLAFEWAMVGYVWLGIRRRVRLRDLVGGRWGRLGDVGRDLAVAALFWAVFEGTAWVLHALLGYDAARSISALLPRTTPEALFWLLVSASAGFCEETVFRGYLRRQFHAATGSAAVAVLAQALVFGFSHGYQGWKQVAIIAVLGVLYGLLAEWRGNLRAGIVAHAWSDVFSGILSQRL